jgi:methylase of polypeptide subunit release factors
MAGGGWNRNIHSHELVLASVPAGCLRALDVGCGAGRLAGELAERCREVIAIDVDPPALARARARHARPNLSFVGRRDDARIRRQQRRGDGKRSARRRHRHPW